jgi:hypothetical protein
MEAKGKIEREKKEALESLLTEHHSRKTAFSSQLEKNYTIEKIHERTATLKHYEEKIYKSFEKHGPNAVQNVMVLAQNKTQLDNTFNPKAPHLEKTLEMQK